MTVAQCMSISDNLFPNNMISPEIKVMWINEIEGKIQDEIFRWAQCEKFQYKYPADAGHELLVDGPHENIYYRYLNAQIANALGETERFATENALFNQAMSDFRRWFMMNYRTYRR